MINWGAISQRSATLLCIVDSTVTAKYYDILNAFLLEKSHALYPKEWRFQQKNAR